MVFFSFFELSLLRLSFTLPRILIHKGIHMFPLCSLNGIPVFCGDYIIIIGLLLCLIARLLQCVIYWKLVAILVLFSLIIYPAHLM